MELIKFAINRHTTEFEIKDLGMVLSRHRDVVECEWNLPWTREVCSRDPEEVRDDGLQGHDHTMASNLKLLSDASSKAVDDTMYHQMICSLMCLTNTRPDT